MVLIIEDSLRMTVNYGFFFLSPSRSDLLRTQSYTMYLWICTFWISVCVYSIYFFLPLRSSTCHFNHVLMFRYYLVCTGFRQVQLASPLDSEIMDRKKPNNCLFVGEWVKTMPIAFVCHKIKNYELYINSIFMNK